MKPVIEVSNVKTIFGSNIIHDGVSFNVKKGEIFGILGGSGSGKSTILRQIIMLQDNQGGEITVLGHALKTIHAKEAHYLRTQWGVLFQFGALFSSLSVLENVGITLKEYSNLSKSEIETIALAKLNMVGLPKKTAYLYPSELSGGMKKRVGLARALAMDPQLLFLDEPTSGLDPASAEEFDRLIIELRNMLGFTVVMVTHDLDTIRYALDRFVVLYNKKVLFDGNYANAKELSHPAMKRFLKTKRGE